ncbi:ABC transporter permease [Leucobacter sp. CSA1]|uniref:ABC transporter permease n=1 Tax=Leucobacter chromiisoli TaxID=2796471 RepID=A0A934USL9_9MICO|nr:ABC transporter permease [Leucobacter chromiisoli]MBK0417439.1 ABC transporter permease [Leucobacter chromiisoli]
MNTQTVPATQHVNAGIPTGQTGLTGSPRLSFGGVIRSEWIKLMSLRSIRVTLIVTFASILGVSLLIALASRSSFEGGPAEAMRMYLITTATFPSAFLSLIFGVLGVFAISSEYSSGMILSTLTAVPKRTPVFLAKSLVLTAVSAVTGLLLVWGGLGLASIMMPDAAAEIFDAQVVSALFGTVVYLVLLALLAYGVATMLRSTAGGITVVVAIIFVMPIAMQLLAITGWEWVPTAAGYLPSNLGTTLSSGIVPEGTPAGMGMGAPEAPGYWVSALAMAVWAAVAVIPAAVLFKSRDAK